MKSLGTYAALALVCTAPLEGQAATVSLEVAAEGRTQITAPHEWLQLLAKVGVANTRIRGANTGDAPSIETLTTRGEPVYHVTGLLTSRGVLQLPGGTFTQRDAVKLRDYFDRLKADGAEAMTATKGKFGLTLKEFEKVLAELSQPTAITATELSAEQFIDRLRGRVDLPISIDPAAERALTSSPLVDRRIGELTIGAALAAAMQQRGLVVIPRKPRGKPVELQIISAKRGQESWPVGYRVKGAPRSLAPDLMQAITVEIDGFTMQEAIDAITPRLKLPIFWDTEAIGVMESIMATDVKLPRARLSYKRILEKLLFQVRLKGELRSDEAGTPFYWITK